jgi:hypothetical protein
MASKGPRTCGLTLKKKRFPPSSPRFHSRQDRVRRGAGETGSASAQVLSAAQSLSNDSSRLKLEVGKFLDSVRAA